MTSLTPKPVSASALNNQMRHIFPSDLNVLGGVFGGKVLADADEIAGMTALRHAGQACVTAKIDSGDFISSAHREDALLYDAAVNRTWNSSIEVGVKAFALNYMTGEKRHIFSTYFVLVALDENGKPVQVRPVIPETEDEKRRYEEADARRIYRLSKRKK